MVVTIGSRGYGLFANAIVEGATSQSPATVAPFTLMEEILFRSGSFGCRSTASTGS